MFNLIKTFFTNLKLADTVVIPNFKPVVIDKLVRESLVSKGAFKDSRQWQGVVIHHAAMEDGACNDWVGIKRYHTSFRVDGIIVTEAEFNSRQLAKQGNLFERPWKDIGYHWGVEREAGTLVVRVGRPASEIGAHAGVPGNNTFNQTHLGICLVGNFDLHKPDGDMVEMAANLVKELMFHYQFQPDAVLGHWETYAKLGIYPPKKSCPGKNFDMVAFRKMLA